MRLTAGVEEYIQSRRGKGYVFEKGECYLLSFLRLTGDLDIGDVEVQDIERYLDNTQTSVITWRLKYQILTRFFDFLSDRSGSLKQLMPPAKRHVRQTFVPYIYRRAQIRSLLKATTLNDNGRSKIDRQTMRTFILLLYGTGALTSEVLGIEHSDVDLQNSRLLIKSRYPLRSRMIPLGRDLVEILRRYLSWRSRKGYSNMLLLVTKKDKVIRGRSACQHFRESEQLPR